MAHVVYWPRRSALLLLCWLPFGTAWGATEDDLFMKGVADVSEGELRFLTTLPARPVHHHQNRITIDDASLATGWVRLEQCHAHLDAVPSAQVVYRADYVRDLRVLRHDNIARAWVEGPSVQLDRIGKDALLCVEAGTRALVALDNGEFVLRNGPYKRQFLDGYYPMRVSLAIHLATDRVRFVEMHPAPQPGLSLEVVGPEMRIEASFEGELRTELRFVPR